MSRQRPTPSARCHASVALPHLGRIAVGFGAPGTGGEVSNALQAAQRAGRRVPRPQVNKVGSRGAARFLEPHPCKGSEHIERGGRGLSRNSVEARRVRYGWTPGAPSTPIQGVQGSREGVHT